MARKLFAALDPASAATASATVVTGKLQVTYDLDGDGTDADAVDVMVSLPSSGAIAPTISGWRGTDSIHTKDGVTNHAVSYINQGPPKRERFEEKHAEIIVDDTGQIPQSSFGNFKIAGSDFASGAGNKTHELPEGSDADYVSVVGTFDGAAGVFRCPSTGTCTSSVDDATGVSLSTGWYFVGHDGAMTSTPDPQYLRFGWWTRDDGKDATVVAFVGEVGADNLESTDIQALEGEATYVGGASGKVSVYDPLVARDIAGAFTARATLTTKFGADDVGGTIDGTIDGFSVDGESQDWSVALKETNIADSGAAAFGGQSAGTSWAIRKETAPDSGAGMWEGTLYETDPDTNVPQTAAGTFQSSYGNVGRMTGAFGATKQ